MASAVYCRAPLPDGEDSPPAPSLEKADARGAVSQLGDSAGLLLAPLAALSFAASGRLRLPAELLHGSSGMSDAVPKPVGSWLDRGSGFTAGS